MELTKGDAPCPVPAGNLLICCSEIMPNETCQGNFQMVPIEAKTFKLEVPVHRNF